MAYIWQQPNWPNFSFDPQPSAVLLVEYAKGMGMLCGATSQISQDDQAEAMLDLMVSEAINTSLIEGERLNVDDLRSSIKNYLGLNQPPARVRDARAEGISALLVDVRRTFREPLTAERLFDWHQMVLHQEDAPWRVPLLRGQWRQAEAPMQIVSGPVTRPVVHYEAPPSHQVPAEMERFLEWYEETSPLPGRQPVLAGPHRAAIAHLWFEAIHPFDDGNGRVGRAIAEHALMQDLNRPLPMSLSAALMACRSDYYAELEAASCGALEVTRWVNWFSETVLTAQRGAALTVEFVLKKARFWAAHQDAEFNDRQLKVLRRLFESGPAGFEGGLNVRKYIGLTSATKPTATRDLADLTARGVLVTTGAGRAIRYALNLDAFPSSAEEPLF